MGINRFWDSQNDPYDVTRRARKDKEPGANPNGVGFDRSGTADTEALSSEETDLGLVGVSDLGPGWSVSGFIPVDRFGEPFCVNTDQCASGYACVGGECKRITTDISASVSGGSTSGPGRCDYNTPGDKCNSGGSDSCTSSPTCGDGRPRQRRLTKEDCCGREPVYVEIFNSNPRISEWRCEAPEVGGGSGCNSITEGLYNIRGTTDGLDESQICSNQVCEQCFGGTCTQRLSVPCQCTGCGDCQVCTANGTCVQDGDKCRYCDTASCPPDDPCGRGYQVEACGINKSDAKAKALSSCLGSRTGSACSYFTLYNPSGPVEGPPGTVQVGFVRNELNGETYGFFRDCSSAPEALDCCGVQCHCNQDCDGGVCVNGVCNAGQSWTQS